MPMDERRGRQPQARTDPVSNRNTVCDQRRLIETRSNIHHGEDAQPSRNPIEVSDSPLEAREMSQCNEPRDA
jgi:hypothetical protein